MGGTQNASRRVQAKRPWLLAAACLIVCAVAFAPLTALAEWAATVTDGALTVVSDSGDAIRIVCNEGVVTVNGTQPEGSAADCASLAAMTVEGGPGGNVIDASGVLTEDFTGLTAVTLSGNGGNDVITGTVLVDTLNGGAGNVTLVGGKGDDLFNGGPGADELIWNNGDNSDTMEGDDGDDVVRVRGAAGRGDAFAVAPVGERTAFTRTNLISFTLDIGSVERLVVEQGEPEDSVQVTPLAEMAVTVEATAPTAGEPAPTAPMVIVAAGDISNTVAAYRLLLGGQDNGGEPGSRPDGFRTITWDGVPDEQAAPNGYDPDFFNAPEAPRARGAVFFTPGEMLQISADADNPTGTPVRFGHINPSYSDIFKTFSEERLFSPVGSNIADIIFFVPGSDTPAVTRGFGAVYTDIDTAHTAFEYFDIEGNSLGAYQAPIADEGLSFLGVIFPEPVIHRVRISYGTSALGPDDGGSVDVAVMDDFIFGEPQAVVEATAGALPESVQAEIERLDVAAPDTPENVAYLTGLESQAELALTHAQLALDALAAGDLTGGRIHSEHVWNILYGESSALFGDINE
ncbi:MAG TPA: hypothetical protein VNK95_20780, partial [Caldilineaceae bacterium]|nr:hypothetical protein [Caldilineaceae bacterium]